MFPVGNDPEFIDFVVCSTEEQKKKLVSFLKERDMTELNGRSLDELVRVETKFFVHPDDAPATAKKKS